MRVRAPLIPEVAFVELPPKKAGNVSLGSSRLGQFLETRPFAHEEVVRQFRRRTLLVENEDIAAVQVDGVSGTETGHCRGDGQQMRGASGE